MPERSGSKSHRRSRTAKNFLKRSGKGESTVWQLTLREIFIGIGIALLVAWLLVGFQFQTVPDYQLGDIADRTIEARQDFTIVDEEATFQKMGRNPPRRSCCL